MHLEFNKHVSRSLDGEFCRFSIRAPNFTKPQVTKPSIERYLEGFFRRLIDLIGPAIQHGPLGKMFPTAAAIFDMTKTRPGPQAQIPCPCKSGSPGSAWRRSFLELKALHFRGNKESLGLLAEEQDGRMAWLPAVKQIQMGQCLFCGCSGAKSVVSLGLGTGKEVPELGRERSSIVASGQADASKGRVRMAPVRTRYSTRLE